MVPLYVSQDNAAGDGDPVWVPTARPSYWASANGHESMVLCPLTTVKMATQETQQMLEERDDIRREQQRLMRSV
jgi:hypothetical protein